jgi:hypothetical protein
MVDVATKLLKMGLFLCSANMVLKDNLNKEKSYTGVNRGLTGV